MTLPLFLGFEVQLIESRCATLPPVVASKALKDPIKISEDIEKKKADQRAELINMPYYTEVTRVVAIAANAKPLFNARLESSADIVKLANDLNELFLSRRDDMTSHQIAFGFDIRERLRQLNVQAARAGSPLDMEFWYHHHLTEPRCVDPRDYVLKKEHQAHLPIETLCAHLGIEVPAGWQSNAAAQASYAHTLVTTMGLSQV